MRNPATITLAREQVHVAARCLQKANLALPHVREENADNAIVALQAAIELLTNDDDG